MPIINGVWRPVRVLPIPTLTAGRNLIARGTLIFGWAFQETTAAAPATLALIDGNDQNGALAVPITLTANQSTRDIFGQPGLYFESGPYLQIVTGSIQGALWYVDATAEELSRSRPPE